MNQLRQRFSARFAFTTLAISAASVGLVGAACAPEVDVETANEINEGPLAEAQQELSTCVTIQRGTFGTVEDTTLVPGITYPGWGGELAKIYTGCCNETLVKFDLSSIPANVTVTSATLGLTSADWVYNATVFARYSLAPWAESTASFDSFNQQVYSQTMGSMVVSSTATAQTMALAPASVQAWINGSVANNGFVLEAMISQAPDYSSWQQGNFESSDSPTVANRPALTVCYTTPPLGTSAGDAATSCGAIKTAAPASASGVYWIDPDGAGAVAPFQAYCDMTTGAAGVHCASNPCQNGGTCADVLSSYTCQCAAGFTGANCQTGPTTASNNPAGSLLVPSSNWVDPAPPAGWTQCGGFINTSADDVTSHVFDNCLNTTRLRMRIWNASSAVVEDMYSTGQNSLSAWPTFNYLGGSITLVKTTEWNSSTVFFTAVGGDACYFSGYNSGFSLGNGNANSINVSPADNDPAKEIRINCNGAARLNYKIALYK